MIKLRRKVDIQTFEVEGTIARGQERPEFLAVVRLAADLGRPINGEDVVRELLGNLPSQIGWRVIERCIQLGLLERDGNKGSATLSDAGRKALEEDMILVPEEGLWRIYFAEDPLLDSPVVHIERFEGVKAYEERNKLYNGNGNRDTDTRIPPQISRALSQTEFFTSIVNGNLFQILELAKSGFKAETKEIYLLLEWPKDGEPSVMLRGKLNRHVSQKGLLEVDHKLQLPLNLEELSYEDLWIKLAAHGSGQEESLIQRYFDEERVLILPTPFDRTLGESEKLTMKKDISVSSISLTSYTESRVAFWQPAEEGKDFNLGRFDETILHQVDLVPMNDDEATKWCQWLQMQAIKSYQTPESLEQTRKEVMKRFPYHQPNPKKSQELLEIAMENSKSSVSRFLLAPYDLGLWRD